MNFGVFVLLYNPNLNDIEPRLKEYAYIFKEVIIVDNSKISCLEFINKILPNARYIYMQGNAGISKALNYTFKLSHSLNLDYLLTMDQDSIYPSEQIYNMINLIEKQKYKNVGIYSANYKKMYFDENSKSFIYSKSALQENETRDVKFCMTSGSFVNVEAVQSALPLEDYFVSYVDVDLSAWFLENGYVLKQVGNSIFEQQVGNTVKANKYNLFFHVLHHNEKRYYFMVRNNFYFREKHKKYSKFGIKRLLRILINILVGEKNKMKKFKACYLGYCDFKKGIKGDIPIEVVSRIS